MKRMGTLLLLTGAVLLSTGCDKVSKKFASEDSCSSEVAKSTIRDIFVDAIEESARAENKQNANDVSALRFDLAKIRATASNRPVITPLRAARKVTIVETFHRGAPRANAASRRLEGTKRSIFSVVRTTTGIAISDKAKLPAQPEKWPSVATAIA